MRLLPSEAVEARIIAVAAIIAIFAATAHARGKTPQDVFEGFGLIGTWSSDCASGGSDKEVQRVTYALSPQGDVTFSALVIRPPEGRDPSIKVTTTGNVTEALLITPDKVKMTTEALTNEAIVDGKPIPSHPTAITIENVTQKFGHKTRLMESVRQNDYLMLVKDGYIYLPDPGEKEWHKTEKQTPLREKCSN